MEPPRATGDSRCVAGLVRETSDSNPFPRPSTLPGMESIPSQLSVGRDFQLLPWRPSRTRRASLAPASLKPNQVSETSLYGVPIVSLVIDGQERLCLAQISNTLLKNYSYNEIHNRRVGPGHHCTPVQLEILRRAGAMPISLAALRHDHETPKYTQPDAANFNSWRRHLKLTDKNSSDDINHAWEDVKAMFNVRGLGCFKNPPASVSPPYGFPGFGLCQKKDDGLADSNKANVPAVFWPSAKDSLYPTFPMFWPTAGGLPLPPYQQSPPKPPTELFGTDLEVSDQSDRCSNTPNDSYHDSERSPSAQSARNDEDKSGDETRVRRRTHQSEEAELHLGLQTLVKDAEAIANSTATETPTAAYAPDFVSESSSYRSISPDRDSVDDPDVDVESNRGHEEEDAIQMSTDCQRSSPVLDPVHPEPKENQDTAAAPSPRPPSPEDANTALSDEERPRAQGSENNVSPPNEVYTDEKDRPVLLKEPSSFESKHFNCLNESNGNYYNPVQ
ncbi:LOW QUALITY PROTEIN: hypothetical protein CRUP_034425 [Coryphaenoides rupestris]|nr:LOW QUALITY PROTEIN: hypothetical protein CRUP_034425 [Coryphaenoides rupestris]